MKKLYKALRQCNKEILRLEKQDMECDIDDDDAWGENSIYIRISKYKKRLITLHKKINNLEGMKANFGRACDKKFKTEASRIPEVNHRIQDVVNKERRFPDYHDILQIYKKVCAEKSLDYSKQEIAHKGKIKSYSVYRYLRGGGTFSKVGAPFTSKVLNDFPLKAYENCHCQKVGAQLRTRFHRPSCTYLIFQARVTPYQGDTKMLKGNYQAPFFWIQIGASLIRQWL